MKNRKINFGIIGCGRIFSKHADAVLSLPNANLAAVCDIRRDRLEKAKKKYKCGGFKDYLKLLKNRNIDVVSICAPSGLHAEMAVNAAKNKKHIICEKPMALNLADANKMIEEAKKNNVKLCLVKQNRYNPAIKKLKEAVIKGRFGKLLIGNITLRWCRPQSYYDQDSWRGTHKMDGGVLMNQADHHIDLLQWIMGKADSVYAFLDTFTHNIEVEDSAVASIKFKNGAIGTIEATTCIHHHNMEGSISVIGENGYVKIGGFSVNKIVHWEFKEKEKNDDEIYEKYSTNPPNIYGEGHAEVYKDFINHLLGYSEKNHSDGYEGKKSLEITLAIYESAKTSLPVNMDEFLKRHLNIRN